jgi:hypothetical protein
MRRFGLALFLLCSALLLAQTDTPDSPERVLAGINIVTDHISDVQKLYTQQQAVYAISQDGYPEGTKLYLWSRLTVTLNVLTEPSAEGERIRNIEVTGEGEPGKKAISQTGRGLSLGAKASEIEKRYGVKAVDGSATITWPDGTTLIVGVNDKGRVNKMELRAPAAAPR